MRICVMHLLSSFQVGGAETVALELGRAMDASVFRILACSLTGPGPMAARFTAADIKPVVLEHSGRIPLYDLLLAWRLAATLRREGVHVVHCHNTFSKLYGAVAGALARVPLVICSQHAVPSAGGVRETHFLARFINPLASHFIAVADYVLRTGTDAGYILQDRASVIYNGIDLARFAQAGADRTSNDGEVVIGCVGRLSEEKRHVVLFRSLSRLAPQYPHLRLHVVGDGPLRQELEDQVDGLGLRERVTFFGLRDDVPELLGKISIFVLASSTEGLPLGVIEAMASGLPVVATRVGALEELVEDGANGFLVPSEDPGALADAIEKLITDDSLRLRMGRRGREMAVEKFGLAAAARRHGELYRRLLAQTGIRHLRTG